MTVRNPEVQGRYEGLDQKQNRVEDFNDFSDSGKQAFSDLSSELGKPKNGGEKYEISDIQDAASKHLDKMVDASGVQVSKLNTHERQKLEDIKKELLGNMDGKDMKTALEEFEKIREQMIGIIAAGDGKSQNNDKMTHQLQEQGKEAQKKTQDAFEKFQDFIQESLATQKEQEKKIQIQKMQAQEGGNMEQQNAQREALVQLSTLGTLS